MSDLGELHWLLGIEIKRDRHARTISLSQRAYIDTIVSRFNLTDASNLSIPLDAGHLLTKDQCPTTEYDINEMRKIPYREAVGSLMYAALGTRPDISFSVTALSQYMQNPGSPHWEAVKRVLRYLKGTRERWLTFGHPKDGLHGFADSNWGSTADDRHSICGYVFTLDGGAVSWSSKKQSVIALSSTEAEYIALTHASKEAIWLRSLLASIYGPSVLSSPSTIHSDNKSAIELVKNNSYHSRTKHIDIRFHYIREIYEAGSIAISHRGTDDMPADMFTKPLARPKLEKFSKLVGLDSV
jgi:hypothetical protein